MWLSSINVPEVFQGSSLGVKLDLWNLKLTQELTNREEKEKKIDVVEDISAWLLGA